MKIRKTNIPFLLDILEKKTSREIGIKELEQLLAKKKEKMRRETKKES